MPTPLLDAEYAAFLVSGLSIVAASRNGALVPSIARVNGCRVSHDRRTVTVYVAGSQAEQLVADVRSNGRIAVACNQASTHRSLQLKAEDARVRPATPEEVAAVPAYVELFARDIIPMGHTMEQARTIFMFRDGDLLAIDFTPSAAFEQTPGPKAGAPLAAPR
ncbi:MAG: hypothetical protein U1F41_12930 [Burkholderiales bacterium]